MIGCSSRIFGQILEPADVASSVPYIAMLHYFGSKGRARVVSNLKGTPIKVPFFLRSRPLFFLSPSGVVSLSGQEMYVIPIMSDDIHFRDILRLEQDKLLVVLVTDKDFIANRPRT